MERGIIGSMEEVAKTAEAYYARLPAAQKQVAIDIFRSMDADGDGTITYYEYISYFRARGSQPDTKFFDLIDQDKNGRLDFNEFLSWHYLASANRLFSCDGCGIFLTGVYFTCSSCFHTPKTYDLCPCCYKSNNHMSHHHSPDVFLDNYALLHFNRRKVLEIQNQLQVHHHHHQHHQPHPQHHHHQATNHHQHHHQGNHIGVGEMMQALDFAVSVANFCSIM